ncbi:MAG: TatD family hydrolase [Ruminococcus sp.]|nr:TatD family hydrolase [Ruminococcus sp.]
MLYNIFDSHSHYDDNRFDKDRDELLSGMLSSTVSYIMHASTDINSAQFGIKLADKYPNIYTSVGIHPLDLDKLEDDTLEKIEEIARDNEKVKAIGEIGLDYHYEPFDKELQKRIFTEQVKLANKLNLPVIVHLREATQDGMEILKKYKPKGVVHCFSGSAETASEVLNLGMYIGFTGVLTFKNSKKARRAASIVPLDRLLLETDCPYMAPEPFRGKRCDSRMISEIAKTAAEIYNLSPQEILDATCENAKVLYGIL